ncbi:hypothetical protein TcasGA2_TC007902 [Tribolium castaneum]|uniref:Uncharacterized protein n=1 Tax=Tribolium castaneum TaxID=7070 RepID=D2A2Y7_TRICA|nr:hypothetical protein TcasGA2_TC007902 [Tribolium castaneum]
MDKDAKDNNHSNQGNPNNSADDSKPSYTQAEKDNRSNQLNPNNDTYYSSRGQEK